MKLAKAKKEHNRNIAELALIAGDGIPAWFWAQSQIDGEDIYDVGMRNLCSETDNFSYRNATVAIDGNDIAAMLLAYRLPDMVDLAELEDLPEFIKPMVELEHQVPGSYYLNMLAAYPQYRNRGLGTLLIEESRQLAIEADCDQLSLEVFDENVAALRLYKRLGFEVIDSREVVPHESHPHRGKILLLTLPVTTELTN